MKVVKTIKLMRVPYNCLKEGDLYRLRIDGTVWRVGKEAGMGGSVISAVIQNNENVIPEDNDMWSPEVQYSIEDLDGADDGGTTWVSIHDRLFEQVARGKSMIHYGVDTTTVETRYV